jgi:hypothetical protein
MLHIVVVVIIIVIVRSLQNVHEMNAYGWSCLSVCLSVRPFTFLKSKTARRILIEFGTDVTLKFRMAVVLLFYSVQKNHLEESCMFIEKSEIIQHFITPY